MTETAIPDKMRDLPTETREWMAGLRPDELNTLKAIVELPEEDIRDAFKLIRDMRIVGRYMRWVIITCISIFVGTVMLYEQFLKFIGFFKGGSSR